VERGAVGERGGAEKTEKPAQRTVGGNGQHYCSAINQTIPINNITKVKPAKKLPINPLAKANPPINRPQVITQIAALTTEGII
jgi:hypothetical protein